MSLTKAIIHERKENGSFASLEDFLTRIKDKDLNKKSLESLVKAGALDQFGDRNEMLLNMEKILNFIKIVNNEENNLQDSLFAFSEESLKHNLHLDKFSPVNKKDALAWGLILIGIGSILLLQNVHFHIWDTIARLWPLVLIVWGGWKLYFGLKEREEKGITSTKV